VKASVAGLAEEGGKIFIARRIAGGALGEKWEFPGGKVEAGETDEEALMREYAEELGVAIRVGAFLGDAVFEHNGEARIVRGYRVSFISRDFVLSEHTEWRWASATEIETLDFAGSDAQLFHQLLKPGARLQPVGLGGPPSGGGRGQRHR
jgi:8-oxo-dGTP diphosphatase